MAKIIKLDGTRKKPGRPVSEQTAPCKHKTVTAYTAFRTVRCSICGALLDPFEVLVDMLKGSGPAEKNNEEKRFLQEMKKRKPGTGNDGKEKE